MVLHRPVELAGLIRRWPTCAADFTGEISDSLGSKPNLGKLPIGRLHVKILRFSLPATPFVEIDMALVR